MKSRLSWLGMAVILFTLSFNIFAFDQKLLIQVRQQVSRIKPFKVDFIQRVYLEGEMEIEESGEILFKDQALLKWTYLNPDIKVFILENDRYSFYDQESNQLIKGKVTENNRRWIWQLLFADEISDHITCHETERKIVIDDENDDLNLTIHIGDDGLPVKVVQMDVSGARYEYIFKKYRIRIKSDDSDFKLVLPDDVDVINEHLD
jgi:outer membrane lipoprotein-sorting protein